MIQSVDYTIRQREKTVVCKNGAIKTMFSASLSVAGGKRVPQTRVLEDLSPEPIYSSSSHPLIVALSAQHQEN